MFIQTSETPNPLTLKFLVGEEVMAEGTRFMTSAQDAVDCPLAEHLFSLEGVASVFLGADFVSVTKSEAALWSALRPFVLATLMDHFLSGQPLFSQPEEGVSQNPSSEPPEDEDEVTREIRSLIDTRVRPAVARDGGDILFDHRDGGIVYVRLQGACSGCPSSTATLRSGIENMLRYYVPEVEEVRAL